MERVVFVADPFAFVFVGLPIKSVVFIYLHCQDETLSERMSQRCEWRAKKTKQKQDFYIRIPLH